MLSCLLSVQHLGCALMGLLGTFKNQISACLLCILLLLCVLYRALDDLLE